MEKYGNVEIARITDIQRQKGEKYKEAVEKISSGEKDLIREGLNILDKNGAIREEAEPEKLHALAADYYLQAEKDKKSITVVTPTHAEGERLSETIRDKLKEQGRITGEEREFSQYKNLNHTEAERSNPDMYQKGDIVQFHKNSRGFIRGEAFTIEGMNEKGEIAMKDIQGKTKTLPLEFADRFNLYEKKEISLAEGDKIRITKNGLTSDKKHKLTNGNIYEVAGFSDKGDIKLKNGWEINKNNGHIASGFYSTSHAAQGKTSDRMLYVAGAESFKAISREGAYVAISRGKEDLKIFTDDRQEFFRAAEKSGERKSAIELVGEDKDKKERNLEKELAEIQRVKQQEKKREIQKNLLIAKYGGEKPQKDWGAFADKEKGKTEKMVKEIVAAGKQKPNFQEKIRQDKERKEQRIQEALKSKGRAENERKKLIEQAANKDKQSEKGHEAARQNRASAVQREFDRQKNLAKEQQRQRLMGRDKGRER
jgi:hypothetical protein